MSARVRDLTVVGVVLLVVLGLETVGLRAGNVGLVIIGGVAALALSLLVFRVDLKWAGVGAACGACFTLTWNGWFLGPVRPGDVLILLALVCFALAHPNAAFRTPPWWVKQLVILLVVGVIAQVYFPPDPVYLSQRIALNATGQQSPIATGDLSITNMFVAFKFIVAVAATPMAFVGATRVDRRAPRWLAIAFATGSALSGTVATVDHLGGDFGRILTGLPNAASRQAGFSNQPNFLAAGLVLAVPFAFWMLFSGRRLDRILGAASLPGIVLGVYASGSRGGAVTTVAVLALCIVLHPRTRSYAPNFAVGGLVLVGITAAALPSFGAKILAVTRLSGGVTTAGSDSVRSLVGAQGIRDFKHSPLTGIGLQASTDASQVYLQELASGGLILFAAMSVYMLGSIFGAYRLMRRSRLAGAVLAALLGTLVLNIFEADLTDRFYYVPAAILIALMETYRRDPDEAEEPAVPAQPALEAVIA